MRKTVFALIFALVSLATFFMFVRHDTSGLNILGTLVAVLILIIFTDIACEIRDGVSLLDESKKNGKAQEMKNRLNKSNPFIVHAILPIVFITALTSLYFVHIKIIFWQLILLELMLVSCIVILAIIIYACSFWGAEVKNIDSSGKVISLDKTDFTFWNIIAYFYVGCGVTLLFLILLLSVYVMSFLGGLPLKYTYAMRFLVKFLLKSIVREKEEVIKCKSYQWD